MSYAITVVLSHLVGMLTAYAFAKTFVFEPSGRSVASELNRFAIVNVFSAGLTWVISMALVYAVFPSLQFRYYPELIAHVIGLVCSSVTSFIGHSRFSFRNDDSDD